MLQLYLIISPKIIRVNHLNILLDGLLNLVTLCLGTYDYNGFEYALTACSAPIRDYFCDIRIQNAIVTKEGAFLTCDGMHPFSSADDSMSGKAGRDRSKFASKYHESAIRFRNSGQANHDLQLYDFVVPIRMFWDDCFNHLSFQSLPVIGNAYHVYRSVWDRITWHASKFSAALLMLLDVPEDRIVIERPLVANVVALPWIKVRLKLILK